MTMDLSAYLDLFVAEARDHIGAAYDLASRSDGEPAGDEDLRELFRHVHSIKGMAASMGFGEMSALAHDAESLMDLAREAHAAPSPEARELLCATLSCLDRMVDSAERKVAVDDTQREELQEGLKQMLGGGAIRAVTLDPGGSAAAPVLRARGKAVPPTECVLASVILKRDRPFPAIQAAVLLGRSTKLGRVVRTEPPMAALRTGRFDGRMAVTLLTGLSPRALGAAIAKLEEVDTFTLGPGEPPAAQATPRGPMATLRVRADRLDELFEDSLDLLTTLGRLEADLGRSQPRSPLSLAGSASRRVARRLYEGLVDVRLVPFDVAAQRLKRAADELSRTLGKPTDFEVDGVDVRVDRSLLEGLMDPLLHMVRNAIDHGIEPREARRKAGKPPAGRVSVRLVRTTARLSLFVEDDGRGLDPRRLKEEAIERGVLTPGEAVKLTDAEAFQLITVPGFSTARTASEVSGRGVGMDVVAAAVATLGGRMRITATPGRGTRFELALPSGVALVQSFLVRASGELFAIPIATISRIAAMDDATTLFRDGRKLWSSGSDEAPVRPLASLYGVAALESGGVPAAILFENGPGGLFGVEVDEIVGRSELIVRPLPGPLAAWPGYSGCALMDDGQIALIVDVDYLRP